MLFLTGQFLFCVSVLPWCCTNAFAGMRNGVVKDRKEQLSVRLLFARAVLTLKCVRIYSQRLSLLIVIFFFRFVFFLTDVIEFTTGGRRRVDSSWTAVMQHIICNSIKQQGQGIYAGE